MADEYDEDEFDFGDGSFGDVEEEGAAAGSSDDEEELEDAPTDDEDDEEDAPTDDEDDEDAAADAAPPPAAGQPRVVRHTGADRVTKNTMCDHEYSGVLQRMAELLSASDTSFLPAGESTEADAMRRAAEHLRKDPRTCPVLVVRRTHVTPAEVHEDVWRVHEMVLPPVAFTDLGA